MIDIILGVYLYIIYRNNPDIIILAMAYLLLIYALWSLWLVEFYNTNLRVCFLIIITLFTIGMTSNMIAVAANSGYMPVSHLVWSKLINTNITVNYNYNTYGGNLLFFGDSILIRDAGCSIGDIMILMGFLLSIGMLFYCVLSNIIKNYEKGWINNK